MTFADRVLMIPAGNPNRPGYILRGGKPKNIVIHETANKAVGANAAMHAAFVKNGGGTEHVSFHYVVDDHESIQLLPDNEVGWHAGDGGGPGNYESVGIETCVNADGDFNKAIHNLARLVIDLMKAYNIPIQNIYQHNHFSSYHKNCPMQMRANGGALWDAFIGLLKGNPAPPSPPPAPETFDTYAQKHPYLGVALDVATTLRVLEDGKTWPTKLFERGLLHQEAPGKPIYEARLGFMWLQATQGKHEGII